MRFVSIKTPVQQSVLMLHRTRQLFAHQRTTLSGLTGVAGAASSDIPIDFHELDEVVLGNIHIAGERMRRSLALVDNG